MILLKKAKSDINSVIFCDIIIDNCPEPEIPCEKCIVFLNYKEEEKKHPSVSQYVF